MDRTKRREIASKGGRAAHLRGTAHEWTREEAREAGRKGGAVLLSSGEDPRTIRVEAIATALDDVAMRLDAIKSDRRGASARAIVTIRRSIERAVEAIEHLEKRMNS